MKEEARRRGRPREFDVNKALDRAMRLFWKKGYDAVTLAELADEMSITKPSLYAAFVDKQGLFEAALQRYSEGPNSFAIRAFSLPTAKAVVEALLEGAVNVSTCKTGPRGCLYTQATMAQDAAVKREAVGNSRDGELMLAKRLHRAQIEGELAKTADCEALALYVKTVALGITVQGASGRSRQELKKVAATAILAMPFLK